MAIVATIFWRALTSSDIFFQRDIATYWLPGVASFVRAVGQGCLPLWDPHPNFGMPMLATPSNQIAYPTTWLNLILMPAVFYKVYVIGHSVLTIIGAWLFARRCALGPVAALVSAGAWCSAGPFLSTANVLHHHAGAAWVPWVLWAFDRLMVWPSLRSAAYLALVLTGQLLAGSADMCLVGGAAAGIWSVFRLVFPLEGLPRAHWQGAFWAAFVSLPYALCLAAIQWLPALSILHLGSRLNMSSAGRTFWSVHPLSLVDLVVPRVIANLPMHWGWRSMLYQGREPFLLSIYLGSAGTVLAFLALASPRRHLALALWLGSSIFVLVALGRFTPLYGMLSHLPLVSVIRYPVKGLLGAQLFWSVLVGLGTECVVDRRRKVSVASLTSVGSLAVACILLWMGVTIQKAPERFAEVVVPVAPARELLQPTVQRLFLTSAVLLVAASLIWARHLFAKDASAGAILGVLAVGDLIAAGRGVNALAPSALLERRPPSVDIVRQTPDARIYLHPVTLVHLNRVIARHPEGWSYEETLALGAQDLLWPPIPGRWAVDSSYDGDFTGLTPAPVTTMTSALAGARGNEWGRRLLQIGGVTHVIGLSDSAGWREVTQIKSVFHDPIRIFAVEPHLPRAYVVEGARVAPDQQALAVLKELDPWREVLLPPPAKPTAPAPEFRGIARIRRRTATTVDVTVDSNRDAHLVLLEGYDPGWLATVDGIPVAVSRANYAFRSVVIPAGSHAVSFVYRPRSVIIGATISAGSALVGLSYALSSKLRRSSVPPVSL